MEDDYGRTPEEGIKMGKKASEEHYRAFLYMVNEQMKEEDANESAQLEIKYISEK